jgi:predicted nuclease with TOPRIM domain
METEKDRVERKLAELRKEEREAVRRHEEAYAETAAANERLWNIRGEIEEAYGLLGRITYGN